MTRRSGGDWPRRDEASGVDVVPAEWLGLASGNQDGEAFMRAFGRHRRGEPEPKGTRCILCGFPCENDQTIFAVPRAFARFSRYYPQADDRIGIPSAHVACSHTMYRGRFNMLARMVEEGASHEAMREALTCWPYAPEEVAEVERAR